MRARILVGALVLGTATGASAQAAEPVGADTTRTEAVRAEASAPLWTRPDREAAEPTVAAAAARVGERVRVEASRPDRLDRWLMAAGATLVVAGLADWAAGDEPGALRDRDFAAYGAGLVLFGTGAVRSAAAVEAPGVPEAGSRRD